MIKLYTTNCPRCKILKQKLEESNIIFEMVTDIKKMIEIGITSVPVLEVNKEFMKYPAAFNWIKERGNQ